MVHNVLTRSIIGFEKDYEGELVEIENDKFLFRLTPKGFNEFVELYSGHLYPPTEWSEAYPQDDTKSKKYTIYFQGGYVYLLADFETVDLCYEEYSGQELIVYFKEDKEDVE